MSAERIWNLGAILRCARTVFPAQFGLLFTRIGLFFVSFRCRGIVEWPLDSHAEGPSSIPAFARYFCPSARHFIHIAALDPGVKWGSGRMRTELWLSWHVRAYKTATGRNAPQGVEKVHFECRIVSESYDRGNNTLWSALIIIWKSAI